MQHSEAPAPTALMEDAGAICADRGRGYQLLVENDQMILGTRQLSDTDRIAPKHLGRNIGWIITGTKNDDLGARDLPRQRFEIAVCRNQDEPVSGSVVRNPAIAASPFRRALSDSGNKSRSN